MLGAEPGTVAAVSGTVWLAVGVLAELAATGAGALGALWWVRRGETAESVEVPAGPAYVPLAERRVYVVAYVRADALRFGYAGTDLDEVRRRAQLTRPSLILQVPAIAEYLPVWQVSNTGADG